MLYSIDMSWVEGGERRKPEILLVCKFDPGTEDIFVILTSVGLKRLRKHGPGSENGYLQYYHKSSGITFQVMNIMRFDIANFSEAPRVDATEGKIADKKVFLIRINDLAYERLQKGERVGDRYNSGQSSKVVVFVDDDEVEFATMESVQKSN